MNKIAIVTDSNSGITQKQAKELGIYVLPMPFTIAEEEFFEDINLTQEEFYKRLEEGADIATSQPSVVAVQKLWKELLTRYEEIVHIPMSSGLSGSCEMAIMLSKDFDTRVEVVNNLRISVTQRQSVLDALSMVGEGLNAAAIRETLERTKLEASIYITVDTLKYLKKGGRITPAAAALGTLLKIKPVLQIQGDKLDAFAKARTIKQAKGIMTKAIQKDIENRFGGYRDGEGVNLQIAHTDNEEAAAELREELREYFPKGEIYIDHLSLSVSCHIGPKALAIACTKKY